MIVPDVFSTCSFISAGFCNAEESLRLNQPILMNQPHGADVLVIDAMPQSCPDCDALVTTTPGLKLTVKTADCAPVLFVDTRKHIIGAAHAGWKGAFQGILENTILTMIKLGATPNTIVAAIGPHLTQQSFQISPEMQALFPPTEACFFKQSSEGIYFDFSSYLYHRLQRAGISKIEQSPIDTFQDKTYNSYRRDPTNPARQYSFIQLKGEV